MSRQLSKDEIKLVRGLVTKAAQIVSSKDATASQLEFARKLALDNRLTIDMLDDGSVKGNKVVTGDSDRAPFTISETHELTA